jgi:hypothetical protein
MKEFYIEVKPALGQEPSPDISSASVNTDALSKRSAQIVGKYICGNTHWKEGENIGTSGDTQTHYRT